VGSSEIDDVAATAHARWPGTQLLDNWTH